MFSNRLETIKNPVSAGLGRFICTIMSESHIDCMTFFSGMDLMFKYEASHIITWQQMKSTGRMQGVPFLVNVKHES
jgi:hypothetical protein